MSSKYLCCMLDMKSNELHLLSSSLESDLSFPANIQINRQIMIRHWDTRTTTFFYCHFSKSMTITGHLFCREITRKDQIKWHSSRKMEKKKHGPRAEHSEEKRRGFCPWREQVRKDQAIFLYSIIAHH